MYQEITWNPWKGCVECSEGCLYCIHSLLIRENIGSFRLPIAKKFIKGISRQELPYKIPSGSIIRVCTTSDFFIDDADVMRILAWQFIHERYDCLFHIVTKRPERIKQCLPDIWLDGWNNVIISVTAETEAEAWNRIPILLDLPIKHMGVSIEPMLEEMDISPFLSSGLIEHVIVGGESYSGYKGIARPLDLKWVKDIQQQCKEYNTNFTFNRTGSQFKVEDRKNPIYIRKNDERNLADFYKLDYIDDYIGSWESTIQDIQKRHLTEQAYQVYKQLTFKDLESGGLKNV